MKVLTAIVVALCLVAAQGALNTKCHNKCSAGAGSCATKTEAAYCTKGYALNSNNKCMKCGNTLQAVAGTGLVGSAVGNGDWWEPWNAGLCTACVVGCETCASKTTCAVAGCKPHFARISATSCVACSANCNTCTSGTVCTKCKKGFKLNTNNACEACQKANCDTCDTAGPAKCDQGGNTGGCKAGFMITTNGSCLSCKTHGAGTGVWAQQAANGGAGICSTCTTGCGTCHSATECATCKNGDVTKKTLGNYLVTASKTCSPCTANCAVCDTNDSNKCKDNASCHKGFQIKADKTCTACDVANGQIMNANACFTCDAHCKTCQDHTKCGAGQCKTGYVLDGVGKCQTCDVANCHACKLASRKANPPGVPAALCNACKPGYFAGDTPVAGDFKTCVQCDPQCKSCQDRYQCNVGQCNDGYGRAGNGKCVACTEPAKGGLCAKNNDMYPKTSGLIGVVSKCNDYPIAVATAAANPKSTQVWKKGADHQCVSCMDGCSKTPANIAFLNGACDCKLCAGGYWPWDNQNPSVQQAAGTKPKGSCKTCVTNCIACATHNTCTTCADGDAVAKTLGFYLDTATSCKNCVANCRKCTVAKATGCDNCHTGFELSNKKTCVACTNDQQTKQGFFWNAAGLAGAGECKVCTANCKACASADTCAVNKCADGYRNNGKVCEKCDQGNCNKCQGAKAKCDTTGCATGFQYALNGNCVACSGAGKHFNNAGAGACATCDVNCKAGQCASATTCNANGCNSGYYTNAQGKCAKCGVANCAVCNAVDAATKCTTCVGKYFLNAAKTSCSIQCDAHATQCTDYWKAAKCDHAKNYYLNGLGRCTYCNVPANANGTPNNAKAGNTYFWDGNFCGHCDTNANGCTALTHTTTCKTGYANDADGICYKKCAAGQLDAGGKGKCFTCGSKALAGRCASRYQVMECTKGYHVQGAGAGHCCSNTESGATGVFGGVSFIAATAASVLALLQ